MTRRDSIWKSLDWVTIVVYLLLIVFGWFSVCGASYDYGDRDFLDFSTRAGKVKHLRCGAEGIPSLNRALSQCT